ncbi:MAG: hypothetical protein A2287_01745 [Candidatus Melainabacteria bacterium RIFOXYA12_FULL_32_12]|nr:MAG: hypothetical protein A2255_01035 [Candidatus Melainabacteria bacterium RIFOXYA2_FULL_32_9]OGI28286.1 MAG: hypothetical protein A2287_01745 [Candidatus Melainabacteria bacterium RIFOXYA12_FULL_32_12]
MIEELQYLSRQELIKRWKKLFKKNSPPNARKELLIKHIAWEMQAKEKGGYSAQTRKKLDKLAESFAKNKEVDNIKPLKESSTLEIKSGTKLIREYKGEKHEVTALDKGFEYNNKTYKSLSAIANEITGTRWNGKVFFGIKK